MIKQGLRLGPANSRPSELGIISCASRAIFYSWTSQRSGSWRNPLHKDWRPYFPVATLSIYTERGGMAPSSVCILPSRAVLQESGKTNGGSTELLPGGSLKNNLRAPIHGLGDIFLLLLKVFFWGWGTTTTALIGFRGNPFPLVLINFPLPQTLFASM